ncbi:MAG: hypothetical protein U0441_32020 [Polyangiaceae bacterium]
MSPPLGDEARSFDAAKGVVARVAIPAGAQEEAADKLPAIDVSAVPGARVTLRRGFSTDAVTVRAACVTAPSDRWAPGLEELVLGRATGLAIAGLGVTVDRWETGPLRTSGARMEQRVAGRTGDREVASIAHTLGFVGDDHDVVLCSIGCAARGDPAIARCDELLAASAIEGALSGPPPPSLLVRSALSIADRPREAATIVAILGAVAAAVIIARRPRVPRRARFL